MRIAVMLRTLDEKGGIAVYSRNLIETLIDLDDRNEYAYEWVHGRVPHKLVVGGKGCEVFRKQYAIPETGWGTDVLFPGYLDQQDLPAIGAADLYLYPSNQEAFPIPLTEAMTCGTPIVTPRANGLEEISGRAGVLVDHRDPAQIADAVGEVLMDPVLAERLAMARLERSCMFSWNACANRTLTILEEVSRSKKPDCF